LAIDCPLPKIKGERGGEKKIRLLERTVYSAIVVRGREKGEKKKGKGKKNS